MKEGGREEELKGKRKVWRNSKKITEASQNEGMSSKKENNLFTFSNRIYLACKGV